MRLIALALAAAGLVAALAARGGPGGQRVYQPSAPAAGIAQQGDFTIEITSVRDRWPSGEPIDVTATLSYRGTRATTIWGAGAGPIAFTIREIGGTRLMEALFTYDCESRELGPAAPIVVDYVKSGGWDPGHDPNEAFYEEFFAEAEFRLPAGRWEVEAWTRFAVEECGPYAVDMRAALVLTVD